MIDACHIVPFSLSKDDTVTNGVSLSPNIHRAFDRGLISFSDDYRLLVSKSIIETNSPYSIKQFEGREILLPKNPGYNPSIENIQWHRKECFLS
jgi:putative restriction endonuclease